MPNGPGAAVYRRFLSLFPRRYREEHGAELERLFADMRAEWEEERGSLGVRFWLALTWDAVRGAGAEWLALSGENIRSLEAGTVGEHMSAFFSDVRFTLRQLVRQPMYGTTIAILMALAIAGNTAVFRVYNGLFLKPLPFEHPERVVDINETAPSWDLEYLQVAYRDFVGWREGSRTFEAMAAYDFGGGNLVTESGAMRVGYFSATHEIDDVVGLTPLLGRFFGPEEDHPDAPRVALLSEGFWQQEFAGDPAVLGRTVSIDGAGVEIIGVLPPEARVLGDAELWLPLRADAEDFDGWGLSAIGLLAEGATIEQARAELDAIHEGMTERYPDHEISSPVIDFLRDRYLGDYRLGSGVLLAAVAIVLLIACANIAGLMTARSLTRGAEIGVRTALGAGRGRIVQQLMTESVVLAAVGAVLGAILGVWGSGALTARLADGFPAWISFELDGRVLLFTVVLTVASALIFGLTPALQASRASMGAWTNRVTASARRRRAMSLLVAGEVALALALLVVGGLSVLDVRRLGRVDPGFDAEELVSYRVSLPRHRYEDRPALLAFTEEYLTRLRGVPGVESAAVTSALPLSGHWGWFYQVDGAPPRAEDEANPVVLNRVVSAGYFETAGIRLLRGRPFDETDGRVDGAPVIIVNETFVRTHLAHLSDPLGARVISGTGPPPEDATWLTVIGVTQDVKHYGVDEEMRPGVYQPLPQLPMSGFQVALRTRGDLGPIMSEVRAATAELDVELPVYSVERMEELLDESLYTRRATSWLIAIFSTVALLMAVAGLYGVISFTVGQRSQEISIRMAMGAENGTVLREVVGQGMRLVALGTSIGLVLSLAGARTVSGILVGVSATNPAVYGGVTALVLAVAGLANYLPARRAAKLDPMRALRGD